VYLRHEVTNIYPEGTSWGKVLWDNVKRISVDANDQVTKIYFTLFF